MREIKFRAYDTRLKMWCYGGEGFTLFGEVLMVDGFSSHFIENPALTDEGVYIPSLDRIYTDIKIMQYTGLKDKNGKEIYEGDIIYWPHLEKQNNEVYFNQKEAAFYGRPIEGDDKTESYLGGLAEVIGNIYSNPELLKTS